MLYTETLTTDTLELLKRLMQDERLSDFYLAGGTNLALTLGHRKSIDLDLFSYRSFDAQLLAEHLTRNYPFIIADLRTRDTIKGTINNVKIDLIAHNYPLLKEPNVYEYSIRLYSKEDIAAMKLVAISDNGQRLKDFVDIAYLSTKLSLSQMLNAYVAKYPAGNQLHVLRGLSYFEDIDFDVQIELTNNRCFNWKIIKQRILEMIRREENVFENEPV